MRESSWLRRSKDHHTETSSTAGPGLTCASHSFNLEQHPEIPVKNLYVIKAMQSLNSRGLVKTQFSWQYCGCPRPNEQLMFWGHDEAQ